MLILPATGSHDCQHSLRQYVEHKDVCVIDRQRRNLKCSRAQITTARPTKASQHIFITMEKKKKSSRIVWLLHNTALLEMLSQNRVQHTNEKKARSTADSQRHVHYGKYHRSGTVWYYIINNVTIWSNDFFSRPPMWPFLCKISLINDLCHARNLQRATK